MGGVNQQPDPLWGRSPASRTLRGTVSQQPDPLPIPRTTLADGIAVVSLGLLAWGAFSYARHYEHGADRTAAFVLLGIAGAAWLVWVLVRGSIGWATAPVLVIVSLAGGALAAFAPVGMVFPAVATLGAATAWRLRAAAAIGTAGWLAMVIAVLASDHSFAIAWGGLAAILAGALIGFTRRQTVERTEQAAQMEVEMAKGEVERARAELLGERNHLAREIHDVLAHTLAALSLQLEAFATVVDGEPQTSTAVRAQLEKTKQLVREGLNESRGAVQALRDDAAPLDDQLRRLAGRHEAAFTVAGDLQRLPAPVVMSLYRVAQEALTNVMKHAPGTPTSVVLAFGTGSVSLCVDNVASAAAPAGGAGAEAGAEAGAGAEPTAGTEAGAAAGAGAGERADRPGTSSGTGTGSGRPQRPLEFLATSGGGYGLRGIAERVALLGGEVEVGPTPDGWRVRAVVPLASAAGSAEPTGSRGSGGNAGTHDTAGTYGSAGSAGTDGGVRRIDRAVSG